jgi:hypothetical protein
MGSGTLFVDEASIFSHRRQELEGIEVLPD